MKRLFSQYGKSILSLLLICTLVVTVLSCGLLTPTAHAADLTIGLNEAMAAMTGTYNGPCFVEDEHGTVWGTETQVEIFRSTYENGSGEITVAGANGEKVIAPGTENSYTFALKNEGLGFMAYKMTMDAWFTGLDGTDIVIPVESRVKGYDWLLGGEEEFRPVLELKQVEDEGVMIAGGVSIYSLDWQWPFEHDPDGDGDISDGDVLDTWLGSQDHDISLTIQINVFYTFIPWTSSVTAPIPDWLNGDDHIAYLYGHPDGTVRPNANITRAEVAAIFYRLLKEDVRNYYYTEDCGYSDVAAKVWYRNEVATLSAMGILEGYPDGTFRGNNTITRAEMAAILARLSEASIKTKGKTIFTDILDHWAEGEIKTIEDFNWIVGYPDSTFRPENAITRAETVTMINRVLHRLPEQESDLLDGMKRWPDNADPTAWYYLAIQEATNGHDYQRLIGTREKWTRLKETQIIN